MNFKSIDNINKSTKIKAISFALVLVTCISFWIGVTSLIEDFNNPLLLVGGIGLIGIILKVMLENKKVEKFVPIIFIGIFLIGFFLFNKEIMAGAIGLTNGFINGLNQNLLLGIPYFGGAGDPTIIILFLASFITTLGLWAEKESLRGLKLFLILTLATLYFTFVGLGHPVLTVAFTIGTVLQILGVCQIRGVEKKLLLVIGLSILLMGLANSVGSVEKIERAGQALAGKAYEIRYGKINSNLITLPKGNLDNIKPLLYDGSAAFIINSPKLAAAYYKNYVGVNYVSGEENRWTEINRESYLNKNLGITQWLNSNNFYPQAQQDGIYRLIEESDFVTEKIRYTGVEKDKILLPYDVAMTKIASPQNSIYERDLTINSNEFLGTKEYEYTRYLGSFLDYDKKKIDQVIKEAKKNKNFSRFKDEEKIYRNFAKENYLTVGKKEKEVLKKFKMSKMKKDSYEDVITYVQKNFDKDYKYNLDLNKAPEGVDPLNNFVNIEKTGNDLHFATAATLMFREAGIPARYVEGYFVSPQYIKNSLVQPNKDQIVTDSMAHSWVEIYVDYVGWVPVEVIPGYFSLKKVDSNEKTTEQVLESEKELHYPDEEKVIFENKILNQVFEKISLGTIIGILIIGLILLFFLARSLFLAMEKGKFLVCKKAYFIKYTTKRMKKLMKLASINLNNDLDAHREEMKNLGDIKYDQMADLIGRLRFGKNVELTAEERKFGQEYISTLRSLVIKKQRPLKAFAIRFILFI